MIFALTEHRVIVIGTTAQRSIERIEVEEP